MNAFLSRLLDKVPKIRLCFCVRVLVIAMLDF